MNTEPMPKCPQCGAALPPDAPDGLCPRCVMAMNLKTETAFSGDATAAQPPLPPEQIAPHFPQLEILECLGRGGMGVVYKARQKSLNRFVALKLLAPERVQDAQFAERFAREAQALAALNHPNIVIIHDFGQAGGFYFLLMEFVDGANLRQLLRTQKFTPEQALAIVPPLCEALQFAHDRGIIHRDIKPENLLLDKTGRVKVADFGIAKMLDADAERSAGLRPGTFQTGDPNEPGRRPALPTALTGEQTIGTRGYSAPEQQTAPQRVDRRADIYSLGVVFYEILTGELPGKKLEAPSKKVQIDVRLDEVVLRALEKNPALRYQQVSEVKTMVETIVATPDASRRRGDESQIEKPNAKEDKSQSLLTSAPTNEGARFSRTAIVGACWVIFTVILLPHFPNILTGRNADGLSFDSVSPAPARLLMILIWLLGMTAPTGTTLLGWVAVAQIRRSAGKLHGLWLAVFDGLLFPLLALDGLIVAAVGLGLWGAGLGWKRTSPPTVPLSYLLFVAVLLGILLLLDWLIIRRVWRAVNVGSTNVPAPEPGIAPGSTSEQAAINTAEWNDPRNWTGPKWLSVYFSKPDSRAWVPKQIPAFGWTVNLGNPRGAFALLTIVGAILIALIALPLAIFKPGHADTRQHDAFGPVIERKLTDDAMVEFDSGKQVQNETSIVPAGGALEKQLLRVTLWNLRVPADMDIATITGPASLLAAGHSVSGTSLAQTVVASGSEGMMQFLVKTESGSETNRLFVTPTLAGTEVRFYVQSEREKREDIGSNPLVLNRAKLGVFDDLNEKSFEGGTKQVIAMLFELEPNTAASQLAASAVTPKVSFGPVMERTVVASSRPPYDEDSYLDLDMGRLLSLAHLDPPVDPFNVDQFYDWRQKSGADVVAQIVHDPETVPANTRNDFSGLIGLNTILIPADRSAWDSISPEAVVAVLVPVKLETTRWTMATTLTNGLPATHLFKTSEGGIGILQITGFTENPRGVQLRYKLVKSASNDPALQSEPKVTSISIPISAPSVGVDYTVTAGSTVDYTVATVSKAFDVSHATVSRTFPPTPKLSFGPELERTVYDYESGKDWLLNFKTGETFRPPASLTWEKNFSAIWEWAHAHGAHVTGFSAFNPHWHPSDPIPVIISLVHGYGPPTAAERGLFAFEMKAVIVPVAPGVTFETVTPSQLDGPLRNQPFPQKNNPSGGPTLPQFASMAWHDAKWQGTDDYLYAFQTEDGQSGLLQITGFTDNPRGVKVRYKLVQPASVPTSP